MKLKIALIISITLFGAFFASTSYGQSGYRKKYVQRELTKLDSQIQNAAKLKGLKRIEVFNVIVEQLKKVIQTAEEFQTPSDPLKAAEAKLDLYQARLKLADFLGRVIIQPNTDQLLVFFQGTDEDRELIKRFTNEPIELYDELSIELNENARNWRRSLQVWVVKAQRISQLRDDVRYMSAWVYLNRAIALNPDDPTENDERRQLLEDLLLKLEPVLRSDSDQAGNRKYWAMWMAAVAYRELGDYSKAWKLLDNNLYRKAPVAVQKQILTERIATHIKQKNFKNAKSEIQQLPERLKGISDKTNDFNIDFQQALLTNYYYRSIAANSDNPKTKADYNLKAEGVVLDLMEKYPDPDIQISMMEFFGRQSGGVEIDRLASLELFAVAKLAIVSGDDDHARKLFEEIISRRDAIAQKLVPRCLWELGLLMDRKQLSKQAADYFLRIANEYPSDRNASKAADYAVISLYKRIQKDSADKESRIEFIRAVVFLFKFAQTHPEIKLDSWYLPYGQQCDKLSYLVSSQAEKKRWLKRGVSALEKVPSADKYMKIQAAELAANMKYRLLQDIKDKNQAAIEAVELRRDYLSLRDDAYQNSLISSNTEEIEYLTNVAAWADFYAAKLLTEQMGQVAKGIDEVEKLSKKWSVAKDMQVSAKQFEIQKLVEEGRIDDAIVKLDSFRQHSHDSVGYLISIVINEIRQSISKLERQPDKWRRVAAYRKAYLDFATQLFGNSVNLSDKQKRDVTLIYVDALNQNGQGKKGLDLIVYVKDQDEKKLDKQRRDIDNFYNQKIILLDQGVSSKEKLLEQIKLFKTDCEKHGLDFSQNFVQLASYYAQLEKNDDQQLLDNARRELKNGFTQLRNRRKQNVGHEINVYLNLARCYKADGQFEKAVDYYNRITQGLDFCQPENIQLFWDIEYELCKTIGENLVKDKQWKEVLNLRIKQLTQRDKELGGLKDKFEGLKRWQR